MSVGLNSLGDHYGISGLGDLFEDFFSSGSDELESILSELKKIEAGVNEIKEQISDLTLYLKKEKPVEYSTKVIDAFSDLVRISHSAIKNAKVESYKGSKYIKYKPGDIKNIKDKGEEILNSINGLKNACHEIDVFLVGDPDDGGGLVTEIAKHNIYKPFVPYYMSVRAACAEYALVYHKAIYCFKLLLAFNKQKDSNNKKELFDFALDESWVTDVEQYIHNLSHAFTREIPMNAERIFNRLNDLPTHGAADHPTFLVDEDFPQNPGGVSVYISSCKYDEKENKHLNFELVHFPRIGQYSVIRADDSNTKKMIFILAPVSPFYYASPNFNDNPLHNDVHFCLYYVNHSPTLSGDYFMLCNLSGLVCGQAWFGRDPLAKATLYPPRFHLYLNHDGTFSLQWYSDRGSYYGQTHKAGHFPKVKHMYDSEPLTDMGLDEIGSIPGFQKGITKHMVLSDQTHPDKFDRSSEDQKFNLTVD